MPPWEKYQESESAPVATKGAPWEKYEELGPPSTAAVAVNAAFKGLAAIPDSVLNAPVHLYNLGKAAFGMTAYALGFKDIGDAVTMTEPPSPMTSALRQPVLTAGGKTVIPQLIREGSEPQTGGQRILDTAVQGAIGMAIAPAKTALGAAANVALGATSGAAAGATKEATGSPLAAIAVGMLTPVAVRHGLNGLGKGATKEVLGETLKDGIEAGYVVPLSAIKPGLLINRVESFGGRAAIKQQAILNNQQLTNTLAKRSIGLPETTELSPELLGSYRIAQAAPYRALDALRPTPEMAWFPRYHETGLLSQWQQAKAEATQMWKIYWRNGEKDARTTAQELDAHADSLMNDLKRLAEANGRPDLIPEIKKASQEIAKSHMIEEALNVGSHNVDPAVLGRMLDAKRPLTGELKLIARFHQAFRQYSQDASGMQAPGISAVEPLASAALGSAGYAIAGPVGAVAGGTLPFLRGPARSLTLSDLMQKRLIREPPGLGETFTKSILAGRTASEQPTAP